MVQRIKEALVLPGYRTETAPTVDAGSREFWSHLADGELVSQECNACGVLQFPLRSSCVACGSSELMLTRLEGPATLFSWIVVRRPTHDALASPYCVALGAFSNERSSIRIPGNLVVSEVPFELVAGLELEVEILRSPSHSGIVFRPA